jgi:signal transduction histidine kinase/ActR/RegA family two-component response regulator
VARLRPLGVEVTHDYASKEGAIPLPATLSLILGESIGEKGSPVQVRLFSDYPFPWRKEEGGPRNGFERQALSHLRQDPAQPFARFEEVEGRPALRYATADLMRPQCVGCHNSHPESPKTDWEVGQVRGVLEVILPMDNVEAVARTGVRGTLILMLALILTGLGLLALVITGLRRSWESEEKLQAQLRHSQKMETIGTLAGGIAHDFNNVLTPILGYANMALQDTPPESRTHSDLQHVASAGKRAKDLVNQILTFSRRSEPERKPVKIDLIVSEALKLLRASLPTTIEFRQKIDADCGTVLADATQIHQVIMNLCTNAFHAMREGGGMLEVNLDVVEADGGMIRPHPNLSPGPYVRLSVSDSGHGMDPETRDRIFEPFFTTKGVGTATGLGLSVVHGIVLSHGGEITVYSEPGLGTTFHVYLPRSEKVAAKEETAVADKEVVITGSERVLVVDDDKEVADMAEQMLKRLGYKVTARTNSVEARDLFLADPAKFDVVITDQTMPRLTGAELAKELLGARPDIPIILISGFSEMITGTKIRKLGIRHYIMKPLVGGELAAAIRRVVDEQEEG